MSNRPSAAFDRGQRTLVALIQQTLMTMHGRSDTPQARVSPVDENASR